MTKDCYLTENGAVKNLCFLQPRLFSPLQGLFLVCPFKKQGRRKDSMFGKVIFPRRAANASPCLDFIIADMFRSVLSNGERIFGKFWGRVLRKDDVKAVCKTLPHTIYFIFYRLRCVFASFLILRRASFLFFEIRKPQERMVVPQLIRHIHLNVPLLIKPIASLINISITRITIKATEKPIEICGTTALTISQTFFISSHLNLSGNKLYR